MKLLLVPAILLLSLPGPAVRFESDGVRVGDERFAEKAISLTSAGDLPILVSGNIVENLSSTGAALEVAIGDKKVFLDVGIRLDRHGEGYRLSTHGPAFTLESSGKSLTAEAAAPFKVTEKGFDLGALGVLEGASLAAKIAPQATTPQDPPPAMQPEPSGPRRTPRSQTTRSNTALRRVFGNYHPLVTGEAADGHAVRMRTQITTSYAP